MTNKPIILCVEDERIVLERLKDELKEVLCEDYSVETAENGEEALEVVTELLEENIEIPLVISDYIMPYMKGDDLLQRIHTISPDTFKVMLTGQATIDSITHVINHAKLYRYIAKPWEPADLKMTVTEAVRSYFQEKKLAQFYTELENKITERTLELNEKNATLIQLNQEKNELLSIVAHDLKNPLSGIQGATEEMISALDEMHKDEMTEWLVMINRGSRQMFDLINNLLDVNVIESGKIKVSLTQVNIFPTLQSLINDYIERAKVKNLTLNFQYNNHAYNACVDKQLVHQILENLISNAIKYSPFGKNISIRVSQDEQYVRCEIEDEGPGLSDDDQDKLFSKFNRLTPQPTGGEQSTGLGLFIVKKLVESMHCKVWCESQLGQGATFVVMFYKGDFKK
jgi:two-component system, sensor histidine kinase and response regulator